MSQPTYKKKSILPFLFIMVLCIPLFMWFAWLLKPRKQLQIALIDKTVMSDNRQEHISLNWVLKNEKFVKANGDLYRSDHDYFGFFPFEKQQYEVKGLERFNPEQISHMANEADMVYVTDTYGVYSNDWYKTNDATERSSILYGGLSSQDLSLLNQMKLNHKLIITEFNCVGSPTSPLIRKQFEDSFGVKWTGWVGRYYNSLDTTVNTELPKWLIKNYRNQHHGAWPFKKSGVAYVHTNETVVILEKETSLIEEVPSIYSNMEAQQHYGLKAKMKYAYWFDIVSTDTTFNHMLSTFKVEVTDSGKAELKRYGIPETFPAISAHINKDYSMFYFSGDFSDNPISLFNANFQGIQYFRWLFYNTWDPIERKSFFWTIYRPLVANILNDYYHSLRHQSGK